MWTKHCVKWLGLKTLYFCFTQSTRLSKGTVPTGVFELPRFNWTCLCEKGSILLQHFIDPNFVISLAYLADVFGILNLLNISLHGTEVSVLAAEEKIQSFQEK
jgi:hypothetical protein